MYLDNRNHMLLLYPYMQMSEIFDSVAVGTL